MIRKLSLLDQLKKKVFILKLVAYMLVNEDTLSCQVVDWFVDEILKQNTMEYSPKSNLGPLSLNLRQFT